MIHPKTLPDDVDAHKKVGGQLLTHDELATLGLCQVVQRILTGIRPYELGCGSFDRGYPNAEFTVVEAAAS